MTRRIAVFSGDRADNGHCTAIMNGISADDRLSGELIALPLESHDDTRVGVARAVGAHVAAMAQILDTSRSDLLVIYGDRSEAHSAAVAATYLQIPIVHCESGDVTNGGCPDDVARHSISAMASAHLATNEQSADALRLIYRNVYVVGLPILDLAHLRATPEQVRDHFHLDERPVVLFCMHPVPGEDIRPAVAAMRDIESIAQVVCLTPNRDAGTTHVLDALADHFHIEPNMSQSLFHGLLAIASCFAGNSSAALKEAPFFNCPAVNVGDRQKGRLHGDNVINVPLDQTAIEQAVIKWETTYDRPKFTSPYGSGNAGKQIAEVLATWEGK